MKQMKNKRNKDRKSIASSRKGTDAQQSKINGYEKEWNINGEKVTFGVEKAL